MPYIKNPPKRRKLDIVAKELNALMPQPEDIAYLLYVFAVRYVDRNWNSMWDYIKALETAIEEFKRRVIAPYEDKKIIENGDVT